MKYVYTVIRDASDLGIRLPGDAAELIDGTLLIRAADNGLVAAFAQGGWLAVYCAVEAPKERQ